MIYSDYSERCVTLDDCLGDALKAINVCPEQRTAFVVRDNLFVGLITDGDIRRGLLDNKSTESLVSEVYNSEPIIYSDGVPASFYEDNQVYPVVENGKLISYYYCKFNFNAYSIKALIMAGGFGTRLKPLTDNLPKPMIEVGNKPILQHIVEELQSQGVNDFVFSTHYLPNVIKNYFGDGSEFNTKIDYLYENEPLGTGGAITLLTEDSDLIITNGDVLTKLSYAKLCQYHYENKCDITVCVRDYSYQVPFGVVYGGELVDSVIEKPVNQYLINSGIYVLSAKLVAELRKAAPPFDIPTKINELIKQGYKVGKYHFEDFWLDIGRPSELEKAQKIFKGESH